jgi:hypothetical protein
MPISVRSLAAAAAVCVAACGTPTSAGDQAMSGSGEAAQAVKSGSLAFAPNTRPFGTTMGDWSARWWRWELSIPASMNPGLDPSGAFCDQGQPTSEAWYLASVFAFGSVTRSCSIPKGRAVIVALSTILNDYPCPDPNFQPAPGQSLGDFLRIGARQFEDAVNVLNLSVDGRNIDGLFNYRFESPLFQFRGDPSLTSAIDPCITGQEQPGVSDGYFVMLKPLTPGAHIVHFGAADTRGFQSAITYQLDVQ